MRYMLILFALMMVTISKVCAEDNWYNILKPYRLNIGLSNDQTWLYTSLDRGLLYYDDGSSPALDQNSEEAIKEKK